VVEQHRGVPALAESATPLATFDGPVRAIRCGLAVVARAAAANIHVSVGLHTAELARHGATISGDGVAVTQAVADRAAPGEVWVTSTLRDLTAGSGLTFESRALIEAPSLGRSLELDAVR
jgi:class 3 adenylate cyclase